jgi:two-component system, OmpR family, response regulator
MSTRNIQSVLYVDDDPDICEVVQSTLRLIAGLSVHIAGSGEQAIDLAYELRPDLVLMDVVMPGLDGPSTLKRMREHALLENIPVIFLTAKILPAEIAQLLELGALGVIGKPFDPLKLCDDLFAIWNNTVAAYAISGSRATQSEVPNQTGSLTGSFLQRTSNDVVRLEAIVELARHGDRSVLREVERIAHSIYGAGAMFGFPDISAAGGAIERLVGRISAGTVVPSTDEAALLQQMVDFTAQLAQEFASAGRPTRRGAGMMTGQDS